MSLRTSNSCIGVGPGNILNDASRSRILRGLRLRTEYNILSRGLNVRDLSRKLWSGMDPESPRGRGGSWGLSRHLHGNGIKARRSRLKTNRDLWRKRIREVNSVRNHVASWHYPDVGAGRLIVLGH